MKKDEVGMKTFGVRWLQVLWAAPLCLALTAAPARGIHGDKRPDVGNHVPVMEFTDLSGAVRTFEADPSQARVTVFFFFELKSDECLRELALLDTFYGTAQDFGLQVYAIESSGLAVAELEQELERYRRLLPGPGFPIIPDRDYRLSALFGVQRLPTTFLVESHGVIFDRTQNFGTFDAIGLVRKLEKLLKVEQGFFSNALREIGIGAEEEKTFSRLTSAELAQRLAPRALPQLMAVGKKVPAFDMTGIDGKVMHWDPSTWEGRVTIVFFWGALCLPCIREMAYLDTIYREARNVGLEIFAVEASGLSPERTRTVMERYRRFHPYPAYAVIPDPNRAISRLFGIAEKIPATFLINSKGDIIYFTDEFIQGHENDLTDKIELALRLEAGSLEAVNLAGVDVAPSKAEIGEAPSIMAGSLRDQEFRSHLAQGDTYYNGWQFAKALPHYLRCLEIDPDLVYLRERVAEIYERKGDLAEALDYWESVLEMKPDHSNAQARIQSLRKQIP